MGGKEATKRLKEINGERSAACKLALSINYWISDI